MSITKSSPSKEVSNTINPDCMISSTNKASLSLVGEAVQNTASEVSDDFEVDKAVIEKLPKDVQVLSTRRHGTGFFVNYCVETLSSDGTLKRYFLKLAPGEDGKALLEGEYHSMSTIHSTLPCFAPLPLAIGSFYRSPTSFYLSDFLSMSTAPPTGPALQAFIGNLVKLHQTTNSPTGQFGYPVTTFHGKFPTPNAWTASWTESFTRILAHFIQLDLEVNGSWPDYEAASRRLLDNVIPRLLDPLTSSGRSIKPCLIHGDLWVGNTGIRDDTAETVIFDAGAMYAHHEMELGMWRSKRHQPWGTAWKQEYLRQWGGWDQPSEMAEDRYKLYGIWSDVIHACHWKGCAERLDAYEAISDLVRIYDPDVEPDSRK